MKFDRLRIVGFKTFVDPTDMVIEQGLTGVVGPNGCGKSNLVEALRWVMGETSHKSMRASGMDDVIFSGSGQRPARNHAEVVLRVDNRSRTAPAAFNEADSLEISRRIDREQGSTYRVNGREVRARDVQLLFADAASGARSPSMVRQGQISEIIAAKPQARRRILEDAAGVAGLHARRHDAELKLKGAEDNLARVVDVLTHIDGQIDGLKRQAKQAERYRAIAAELRKTEAMAHQIAWFEAEAVAQGAERQLDMATRAVATAMAAQGQAERERGVAQHAIEPLRSAEMQANDGLQRLMIARETLDGEEKRAQSRLSEIERRLKELNSDRERAQLLADDAETALTRLTTELAALAAEQTDGTAEAAAQQRSRMAEKAVQDAEQALQALQVALAEANAGRAAADRAVTEATARLQRCQDQLNDAERQKKLMESAELTGDLLALRKAIAEAATAAEAAEQAATAQDKALRVARDSEMALRPAFQDAERTTQRLETEARTIRKMFDSGASGRWNRVLDEIIVEKGYEAALGAAFGDDLEASTDPAAPIRWASAVASPDVALPMGAEPLHHHVRVPQALARKLAHIGVVARADGARLAPLLAPGQRLVSVEGDLWRWDGLTAAADAPSSATRRLAEKNRLGDIEAAAASAAQKRNIAREAVEAAVAGVQAAMQMEYAAREEARLARRRLDAAREAATNAERRAAETDARSRALADTIGRLKADMAELDGARRGAEAMRAAAKDPTELTQRAAEARALAAECRSVAAQARVELEGLMREREQKRQRHDSLKQGIEEWSARKVQSAQQTIELSQRLADTKAERTALDGLPAEIMARRRALGGEIEAAEASRKLAADRRAEGETALAVFDRAAREAMTALSQTREGRARAEAQRDAAQQRLEMLAQDTEAATGLAPTALSEATGYMSLAEFPAGARGESRLTDLKRERERIGAVNLRAEEELAEVEANKANLAREHEELTEAIRRLRRGIESLNAEGRNRLIAAFEVVNGHFKTLFSRLFGGGTAELQLIESDDPLEAGLEILAHPPGKKPQVLTLLSGGEQALTATALIFAVFLTNPSPVCVLDEVDAPLDDSNVDRLCDLLITMAKETETRFVVITHNPISMARMDRLFGVTMAERGVSQLVSVDLAEAERLAEAV